MIALLAEDAALAGPLIKHYQLVRVPLRAGFPLFRSRPQRGVKDPAENAAGEVALLVSGSEDSHVAAATGYLFGLCAADGSAHEVTMVAGIFRYPMGGTPRAPVALVVRAVAGDRSITAVCDTLFRHSLPELTVESPGSAVPAFMRAALAWTGPHRVVALCADPDASDAGVYAGTADEVIAAACDAADPPGRASAQAGRAAAVRIATALRLSRTRQARLEQLLAEYASRHNGRVPDLPRLFSAAHRRADPAGIFSDLEQLLERESR